MSKLQATRTSFTTPFQLIVWSLSVKALVDILNNLKDHRVVLIGVRLAERKNPDYKGGRKGVMAAIKTLLEGGEVEVEEEEEEAEEKEEEEEEGDEENDDEDEVEDEEGEEDLDKEEEE